jgi:glucose-specific phosphotransferase system IIA component
MMRVDILSPFTGRVVPLEQLPDPVFAEKMVGDGVAVEPTEGLGLAPAAGTLAVFHSAGHAFAVQITDEIGVLVHIGLNTVQMKGDGFTRRAEVKQAVTAGQEIVRFDLGRIAAAGFSALSPVIMPDLPEAYEIQRTGVTSVRAGQDVLFSIVRRP